MGLTVDDHFYRYVLPLVVIETLFYTYAFLSDLRTCQVVLGLVGLWWCCAALWVEIKIEQTYPGFDYENPVDPEMKAYKPFCDFGPGWATCSKVLMSPPGRFLRYFGVSKQGGGETMLDKVRSLIDVPNPTLGVLFFGAHLFYPALLLIGPPYVPISFLWWIPVVLPWLFFAACVFVGFMTVWLAYNLIFVLADLCVVCVSMYVANFALIPMMYKICEKHYVFADFQDKFFGSVPTWILYPFLALDAVMFVAVCVLYLVGPSHQKQSDYLPLDAGNGKA